MQTKRIEPDKHLLSAGECFMFLCWVESTMRDLLVLYEGDADLRSSYNNAYGSAPHPREFSRKRLELGQLTFGNIKNRFFSAWPHWENDTEIHEAIERIVIYRNGFGHAQIQPFRQYLLYTPMPATRNAIQEYMRCSICFKRLKCCNCERDDLAEPLTLKFSCLDDSFRQQLYGDIRTVDVSCFLPTAKVLNVCYQGVAWPEGENYVLAQHYPTESK